MNRNGCLGVGAVIGTLLALAGLPAQQVADPNFDTRIANPAFMDRHPRVLLDEAHHGHSAAGTYKPFVELITNDGYVVRINKQRFAPALLAACDILVIPLAVGAVTDTDPKPNMSAFTATEQDAVLDWVRNGVAKLLGRFGIESSGGYTVDTTAGNRLERNLSTLIFSRENGLLGDSVLTNGRHSRERVVRVFTFTGTSFKAPVGVITFLHISKTGLEVFSDRPVFTLKQLNTPPA
ncbi:MAG: hypothetical protein ACREOW_18240 [Thermodesulfobacteriota bacterium]